MRRMKRLGFLLLFLGACRIERDTDFEVAPHAGVYATLTDVPVPFPAVMFPAGLAAPTNAAPIGPKSRLSFFCRFATEAEAKVWPGAVTETVKLPPRGNNENV